MVGTNQQPLGTLVTRDFHSSAHLGPNSSALWTLGLQVSHSATSPQLKGRNYPMFGRTILSDTLLTEAVIRLCNRLGWAKVGVLHDDADKWSLDFAQAIVTNAPVFGVRCVCCT